LLNWFQSVCRWFKRVLCWC